MKSRTYNKYQTAYEMHVYDGNKLLCHCLFYPAKGYTFPRYHFENFGLLHTELNYEICRFMKFVNKCLAFPQFDLESIDAEINWDLR